MNFREQIVIRILLIVAGMLTQDVALRRELHALATHIAVHLKES